MFSEKEVDISERAYHFILSVISKNIMNFSQEANEFWGKYKTAGKLLFNKNVLCEILSKNGFEFDAIKRKWKEKGYIELNSQGKYVHQRKMHNITTPFVLLDTDILKDDDDYEVETCPF